MLGVKPLSRRGRLSITATPSQFVPQRLRAVSRASRSESPTPHRESVGEASASSAEPVLSR